MSIPPDLAALLSAHDQAVGPQGPSQGPPPGPGDQIDSPPPDQPEEDPVAILDRMIQDAQAFIKTQQTDPIDTETMGKVLQQLLGYKAKEQKDQQDAMQGKLSPKVMSKAYGGP